MIQCYLENTTAKLRETNIGEAVIETWQVGEPYVDEYKLVKGSIEDLMKAIEAKAKEIEKNSGSDSEFVRQCTIFANQFHCIETEMFCALYDGEYEELIQYFSPTQIHIS